MAYDSTYQPNFRVRVCNLRESFSFSFSVPVLWSGCTAASCCVRNGMLMEEPSAGPYSTFPLAHPVLRTKGWV
jgi:hypothetical protein